MDSRKIIYLDDAIDAVLKLTYADGAYGYAYAKDLVDSLENLPSAQPEQAVKGCRNCKYGKYNDHWKTRFCYNPNECTEWNLWEPNAQPEIKPIEYRECANAMLKMWIDNVLTDGEYNRIMDKLNSFWKERREDG